MPCATNAIAGGVTWFAVLNPVVQGFTLVGPLLAAIIASDCIPRADWLGVAGCEQWRPVLGAIVVAYAFAAAGYVTIEDVQRHLLWPYESTLQDSCRAVDAGVACGNVTGGQSQQGGG